MTSFPDYRGTLFTSGFFGISTILMFWAVVLRATRDWGSHDGPGRAFGLLDSGQGLLATGMVSFIGYIPDIFVTLVAGILIDRSPGLEGPQHFFFFLAGYALSRITRKQN